MEGGWREAPPSRQRCDGKPLQRQRTDTRDSDTSPPACFWEKGLGWYLGGNGGGGVKEHLGKVVQKRDPMSLQAEGTEGCTSRLACLRTGYTNRARRELLFPRYPVALRPRRGPALEGGRAHSPVASVNQLDWTFAYLDAPYALLQTQKIPIAQSGGNRQRRSQ